MTPPFFVFFVGHWYRITFKLGESWVGRCIGEDVEEGVRLVLFDVGQRDGDPEVMDAGIQVSGITSCEEVDGDSIEPYREADMLLWRVIS